MALLFENETCSRCSGTGNYSYCQQYGTRCFKCHGAKVVLTKRGLIAQAYLTQLQTVPLSALQLGSIIQFHGITVGGQPFSYKAPVMAIEKTDQTCQYGATDNGVTISKTVNYVCIKAIHSKLGEVSQLVGNDTMVRVWPNTQDNINKALEYQASLTKTGTVKKIKNKTKV